MTDPRPRIGQSSGSTRSDLQIGPPQLVSDYNSAYFKILKGWLQDCNDNHREKCGHGPDRDSRGAAEHPTRLLDIGTSDETDLRLVTSATILPDEALKLRYVALSYPWGDKDKHKHFQTTRENLGEHLAGISLAKLPTLFQHAIRVAREIDIQYLWIDSLCIIQGIEGDFQTEATRMELVFSGAYCVLAASRATGVSDGFLESRQQRDSVSLTTAPGSQIFLCEDIDDFQREVIDGHLNKRGWVLQERALARRTIYFTGRQTYWECGRGIRCETFTQMHNAQASHLGDSDSPKVIEESTKGTQILSYQKLYEKYSQLGFSRISDRPLGISGLEQRLLHALKTKGGFGIFRSHIGRGLLWQRALDQHTLTPICFSDNQQPVPTWSWMHYEGAITFLEAPLGGIDWNLKEFSWSWGQSSEHVQSRLLLNVVVRDIRMDIPLDQDHGYHFFLDCANRSTDSLNCVVIGKHRGEHSSKQRGYVLLVGGRIESDSYARVGAGIFPARHIEFAGQGEKATVR